MSSTVETIYTNIENKFECLISLIEIFSSYQLDQKDDLQLTQLHAEILELRDSYVTSTTCSLNDYFIATTDEAKRASHTLYIKTFHSMNLIGKLNHIKNLLVRLNRIYDTGLDDIQRKFQAYDSSIVDEKFESTPSNICPKCHIPYDIIEKTSEFVCYSCGKTEKIKGVVFEDEQIYYQEGKRTKHGKYDPIKHAKFWLDRIQGKENTEIPKTVLNKLRRSMRNDSVDISSISCETIRLYLKDNKLTTPYNNHVPLIRKLLTGIEPDQLTDHESRLACLYFARVISIFTTIKGDDKSNCPYYPFFFYKIIEQILKSKKDRLRKKRILSCIHLQSRETLIDNDRIWEGICEYIPEFVYIVTMVVAK